MFHIQLSEQYHILRLIVEVSDGYVGFTQGLTLVSSNFTRPMAIRRDENNRNGILDQTMVPGMIDKKTMR